jgi:hypothetical protein
VREEVAVWKWYGIVNWPCKMKSVQSYLGMQVTLVERVPKTAPKGAFFIGTQTLIV